MKCYYCGARLNRTNTCPACRQNVYIWKRAKFVSNFLYNDGLELAKRRDFTGATESLETSLQYDKRNTQARNLLGLIYYEIGEWYAAAVQWNISLSFDAEDNLAASYLEELQDRTSQIEHANQAIRKYNQCLQYCRQKNYDLALIQLRKVFELNPNFLKGYQLAALLQMRDGQYEEAMHFLKKAASIDRRNPTTRYYMNECRQHLTKDGKLIEPKKKRNLSVKQAFMKFQDRVVIAAVTNVAIGLVAGMAIFGFLILPAMRLNNAAETSQEIIAVNEAAAAKEQENTALETKVESLEKKLNSQKKKTDSAELQVAAYQQLTDVYDLVVEKNYEDAKTELSEVDTQILDEAGIDTYHALSENIERNLQAKQWAEEEAERKRQAEERSYDDSDDYDGDDDSGYDGGDESDDGDSYESDQDVSEYDEE